MDIANLDKAARLAREIGWLERDLAAYRYADEISVAVGRYDRRDGVGHQVVLTAAEIGDHIVDALQRRLATMRAKLRALGVDDTAAPPPGAWFKHAPSDPGRQ